MIVRDKLYIGGTWTAPSNTAQLDILSPQDPSLVGRSVQAEPADVDPRGRRGPPGIRRWPVAAYHPEGARGT
jgi:hypothetical protein